MNMKKIGRKVSICVFYKRKKMSLKEASKKSGIPYTTLIDRIKLNGCKNLFRDNKPKLIKFKGKNMTIRQASEKIGITANCLKNRIYGKTKDLFNPENLTGRALNSGPKTTIFYDYKGKKMNLKQISKVSGVKLSTLKVRKFRTGDIYLLNGKIK